MSTDLREPDQDFAALADPYRRELTAHCYRMLGSVHDAEDLVQETLFRAWRGYQRFDGRSSIRTWLYRIATNACLTALQSRQRRVLPSGLGNADGESDGIDTTRLDQLPWISPFPTAGADTDGDPAAVAITRQGTRLALVVAFQRLPARQRAMLLLVEVVGLRVAEAAEFLGTTRASGRSLLQRARATLAADAPVLGSGADTEVDRALLDRYQAAFEAADVATIATLLRDDVEYEMPPIKAWFRGRAAVLAHLERRAFSRPSRTVPTRANGAPAFASYFLGEDGDWYPHAIDVLESDNGLVARVVVFLDTTLFRHFGLPDRLPPVDR